MIIDQRVAGGVVAGRRRRAPLEWAILSSMPRASSQQRVALSRLRQHVRLCLSGF
ncbi:hypothetical protein KCP75_05370 [Salmonella enterica subsp. enterica]|nr:hypothetical protein KCP75_05370 [Salmonella enterica subsp. enterica]